MANIRKPNKLHELKGTYRKDRHGEKGDSLDDFDFPVLPPPPINLTDGARNEWYRVVELLEHSKLLKATDYGIMISYCRLFELIISGQADSKVTIHTQFRMVANELGLTPVARSKINMGNSKHKGEDPYQDF
jgi:phage terminase small subunit